MTTNMTNRYKDEKGRIWKTYLGTEYPESHFLAMIAEWDGLEDKAFASKCGCCYRGRRDVRGRRTRFGKFMDEHEAALMHKYQVFLARH